MRVLLLVGLVVHLTTADFESLCRRQLAQGRQTVRAMAERLVQEEGERKVEALGRRMESLIKVNAKMRARGRESTLHTKFGMFLERRSKEQLDDSGSTTSCTGCSGGTTPSPCPNVSDSCPRLPGTFSTTVITTEGTTTAPIGAATTGSNGATTAGSTGATTAGPVEDEQDAEDIYYDRHHHDTDEEERIRKVDRDGKPFVAPMHIARRDYDPSVFLLEEMMRYLSAEDAVCAGPKFENLSTITHEQLFGFFANLAAVNPGPFCGLCNGFVDAIKEHVIMSRLKLKDPLEAEMTRTLIELMPSTKSICSTFAPACYQHYQAKATNYTPSLDCLKCNVCMSLLSVLQHRVLLSERVYNQVLRWFQDHLVGCICSWICHLQAGTDGAGDIPFDQCLAFGTHLVKDVLDYARDSLRPERVCPLELGWCDVGEDANILHCLRDLCNEVLGNSAPALWLCNQIPDRPVDSNRFLNIPEKPRPKRSEL